MLTGNLVGGYKVQRDLYSAFLIKNADGKMTAPDREKCAYEFDHFLRMHDELIGRMRSENVIMRQCFGF